MKQQLFNSNITNPILLNIVSKTCKNKMSEKQTIKQNKTGEFSALETFISDPFRILGKLIQKTYSGKV